MEEKKENVVVYQRISKGENVEKSLSVEQFALDRFSQKSGLEITEKYVDIHKSTVEDRPAFNRLMKDVALGKISKVVVIGGLSRLSRNHEEMIKIFESFDIIEVEPTITISNWNNEPMQDNIVIKDFFNERYAKDLRKRIKQGIALSKKKKQT